eukprot:gene4425-4744_t
MTVQDELLGTFEAVRLRAHNFCAFRNWEKFHLPASLALALSGECGEVCEIFQWKGTLESDLKENDIAKLFTDKEITHIGEEIADVCIYTTRLCDICNINLGNAVLQSLQSSHPDVQLIFDLISAPRPWPDSITLKQVSSLLIPKSQQYRSQRAISLDLQSKVGELCSVFSKYSELDSTPGLPRWHQNDIVHLSQHAAQIIILMICLANICNLSIDKCITDKFYKNDAKYPVALSKGSSAKYTTYVNHFQNKDQYFITIAWIGFATACFLAGRYTPFK